MTTANDSLAQRYHEAVERAHQRMQSTERLAIATQVLCAILSNRDSPGGATYDEDGRRNQVAMAFEYADELIAQSFPRSTSFSPTLAAPYGQEKKS